MTTTQQDKLYDNRPSEEKVHELCKRRGITGYELVDFEDTTSGGFRTLETAVVVGGKEIAVVSTTRKGLVRWHGFMTSDPTLGVW